MERSTRPSTSTLASGRQADGRRRVRAVPAAVLLSLLVLTGCYEDGLVADLLVDRRPTSLSIQVDPADGRLVAGQQATAEVTVLDQTGTPFTDVPPWGLVWRTTDDSVATGSGSVVSAVGPGMATVTVSAAGLEAATEFRVNPELLEFRIEGVQPVQAVQRMSGDVPLVAGRPAYLRVFLSGAVVNFFRPAVEVRLYHDGSLTETVMVPALAEGVPVQVDEGNRYRSWNVPIPAEVIRPGLAVSVVVDPDGVIPRAPGTVDRYPAGEAPVLLDVREPPEFRLRFVPVHQVEFGSTGDITPGNADAYLELFLHAFPIGAYDYDIRAPLTTTASADDSSDPSRIIQETRALRLADGSSRYYYGVYELHGYAHGGLGYISYPVSVGRDSEWGYGREDARGYVFAHELGHNFGRLHAPCNTTGDVDYPYPDGRIGRWAWDARIDSLLPPQTPDLMSYCTPGWSSDYTYEAVLAFREQEAARGGPALTSSVPVLVVWGALSDDGIVVNPAFTLEEAAPTPERPGPYQVEGLDAAGGVLFSRTFEGEPVSEAPAGDRHFLLAIPLSDVRPERLAGLRVSGSGRVAEVRPAAAGHESRTMALRSQLNELRPVRVGPERVRVRWDAERFPLAVVRDGETGDILSFARGGDVAVFTRAARLDVALSDGVLSQSMIVPVEHP